MCILQISISLRKRLRKLPWMHKHDKNVNPCPISIIRTYKNYMFSQNRPIMWKPQFSRWQCCLVFNQGRQLIGLFSCNSSSTVVADSSVPILWPSFLQFPKSGLENIKANWEKFNSFDAYIFCSLYSLIMYELSVLNSFRMEEFIFERVCGEAHFSWRISGSTQFTPIAFGRHPSRLVAAKRPFMSGSSCSYTGKKISKPMEGNLLHAKKTSK